MNARIEFLTLEVEIHEGAELVLGNPEGARLRVSGPATLTGTATLVRELLWVIFPAQRGFGLAIERPRPKTVKGFEPQKADDLKTAWENATVEVYQVLRDGRRKDYFDD